MISYDRSQNILPRKQSFGSSFSIKQIFFCRDLWWQKSIFIGSSFSVWPIRMLCYFGLRPIGSSTFRPHVTTVNTSNMARFGAVCKIEMVAKICKNKKKFDKKERRDILKQHDVFPKRRRKGSSPQSWKRTGHYFDEWSTYMQQVQKYKINLKYFHTW